MKVIDMSAALNNGTLRTPKGALEDAIADIGEHGALKSGKKIIIISLDDTEGQYSANWYQAGMKMSEMLSLLEVAKQIVLQEMNH